MMRVGVGVLSVVACVRIAAADGKSALDKPAMTASAAELLAVAKATPASDDQVETLREDSEISLDERGRATTHLRWVRLVRTQEGLDDWDSVGASWDPDYQDRPVLRVRVIDPAGTVTVVDPAAMTEPARAATGGRLHYLEAALPPRPIGSVIEQDVVTVDREPALGLGGVAMCELYRGDRIASGVITLSAPVASHAHHVVHALPGARTSHRVDHGRELWRTEVPAMPAAHWEGDVPAEVVTTPFVALSTNASWSAVAAAYRAITERRLAEAPFALPAELPRSATIESVNAITAWVHRTIKHAGVRVSRALQLPGSPAETIRRGAGSDEDRAGLLVSLLRQAGITAELVVTTRERSVLDPALPGLAPFGRTLVRARLAGKELWIDPSEPLARPGELSADDRDRPALVIASESRALITTPRAVAADNVAHEVRTFVASEHGPAQVTEVSQATGTLDIAQRSWAARVSAAEIASNAAEYVRSQYGGELVRRTASAADDLATPFQVTFEAKDIRRMVTDREQIGVFLYPRAALVDVPTYLTKPAKAPRVADFAWPTPHIYEVENRIVVPPGYTMPAPAPDRTRAIGTASFAEHQEAQGQTFVVRYRFDSGKRRLTAAELAQLQSALHDLQAEVVHLKIDLTSSALGYAGKPREAIAEATRLIALHPREAVHHDQLARALLHAGAGEAARREAKQAVAIAPDDAEALTVLGRTLACDSFGRAYGFDWDRAGALTALQRARKLAPSNADTLMALSDIALHDPRGRAFEPGADLELALDAARALFALDQTDAHALAVVKLLAWLGRYAEAATLADTVTSADKDPWLVAMTAAQRGAPAGIEKAAALGSGTERGKLTDAAAAMLLAIRLYEPARGLAAQTGNLARSEFGSALNEIAARPAISPVTQDPRDAVRLALAACLDPDRDASVFWSAQTAEDARHGCALQTLGVKREGVTGGFLWDVLQAQLQLRAEGDAGLWRVDGTQAGQTAPQFHMYVALDHGRAKVLGDPDIVVGIGHYLAQALAHGQDAAAKRLIDWLAQDLPANQGRTTVFHQLWGAGLPTDRVAMQRVAAVLLVEGDPARAIALLGSCATTIAGVEQACRRILLGAYVEARRWAEVETEYAQMLAADPSARRFWYSHVTALIGLARFDEADHALDDVLAGAPDNHEALALRVRVALGRGQSDEAVRRVDALVAGAASSFKDLNLAAWLRVALGRDLDGAIALARRALAQEPKSIGTRNTLAVAELEHGDLAAALQDGWDSMASYLHGPPRSGDWYLMGRRCEQLGLTGDAIAAYRKVEADSNPWMSTYELAGQRLTALHASH